MSKKSYLKAVTMLLISSFALHAGAEASQVSSHAYLYVKPQKESEKNSFVEVIVQQQDSIARLACGPIDAGHLPSTPKALSDLLQSKLCREPVPEGGEKYSDQGRLFHQAQDHRFQFVSTDILWDFPAHSKLTGVSSQTSVTTFEPNHKDTLNIAWTSISVPANESPQIRTTHISRPLAYEADVNYPAITTKPVEQP